MRIEVGKQYLTVNGSVIDIRETHYSDQMKGNIVSGGYGHGNHSDMGWNAGTTGWTWQIDTGEFSGFGVGKDDFPLNIVSENIFPLVVGGIYRTRGGSKVEIISTDASRWPFNGVYISSDGKKHPCSWRDDGVFYSEIEEQSLDIIGLWTEAPQQSVKTVWKKRNDTFPWGGFIKAEVETKSFTIDGVDAGVLS